jgi:hypothetical protein
LERQLKKKDKEIKRYSDLVASTKSAIDTLERDQQELAIIKHKGCANCGSPYSAPDPSLFPPEPTQTFVALGAGGQRAPALASPKKLREEKAEEEDTDEAESPLVDATAITSQAAPSSSSVAAPVGDAAPKSGLERMQALKEKARRMKESNNRSASCARIPATSTTQPKSILKRRATTATTDDDKENFVNA